MFCLSNIFQNMSRYLLLLIAFTPSLIIASTNSREPSDCRLRNKVCGELFLTIGAVSNKLEFNWDFTSNCNGCPPDTLVLYYQDQTLKTPRMNIEVISVKGVPQGHQGSEFIFGKPSFPGHWNEYDDNPKLESVCYPYWVESLRGGEVVDSACIKIEPAWMQHFGDMKISEMFIPGTHDSGAYTGNANGLIKRYTFTQDYNLWGQLVSGIRYFDIRVGIYKNLNPIEWINHGVVRCSKMEKEFKHIAHFLNKSPKEVVILHFHSFENPKRFTQKEHQIVLDLIQRVLGDHILPRQDFFLHSQGPALEEIWKTGKRLIITYDNDETVTKHDWLWYRLPHKWGNKQSSSSLYKYLKTIKGKHTHPQTPFCALMCTLTPTPEYMLQNLGGSLRHMADEVNPLLNFWVADEQWEKDINIIATDFFMGNNMIDTAIAANRRKQLQRTINRK